MTTEKVDPNKPSPEQTLFANTVLEIISPTVESFGFVKDSIEIKQYSTNIIFRKGKLYIKISSSTYPRDQPYFYNLILGEGDSENFYEFDWNSIALWRLKTKINARAKAKEFKFPYGDKVKFSVINANNELVKYADSFLHGELTIFYEIRSQQNKNREPFKIHTPDKDGNYQTTDDPKSVEQKKKYS